MTDNATPNPGRPAAGRSPGRARAGRAAAAARGWLADTVVPALAAVLSAIARLIERAEERVVSLLTRGGRAVAAGVQRAEAWAVPRLTRCGRAVAAGLQRAQEGIVPRLATAGRSIVAGVQRGQERAVPTIAALGGGVVTAVQRAEARAVPWLAACGRAIRRTVTPSASTSTSGSDRPRRVVAPAPDSLRGRVLAALVWAGLAETPQTQRRRPSAATVPAVAVQPRRRTRRRGARPQPRAVARLIAVTGLIVTLAVSSVAVLMVGSSIAEPVLRGAASAVDVELKLPDKAALEPLAERSVVYAADGSELAVLHDEVNRRVVGLDKIPEQVRNAVITAEDRKFYEHEGYDLEGIGRALLANARAREIEQGGSTLTQQLAKSIVGNELTLDRKISELTYAVALERRFSKDELLERYLNQVYFGSGAYGVAAASEEYFGIPPRDLKAHQSALLAGMIRSPGLARANPEAAKQRRDQVLRDMARLGYMNPANLDRFLAKPLGVQPPSQNRWRMPYVVAAAIEEFVDNPAFGKTREERYEKLYSGGVRIYTTVRPRLQQLAGEVVSDYFPVGGGPTASIVTVEPKTGRVLAAHGGYDFQQNRFNLATQGRRQPGSSFKPFVYAAALRMGYPLSVSLEGSSGTVFDDGSTEGWPVQNYGGSSYGNMDMFTALRRSANTAAAQLMLMIGREPACKLAGEMGIAVVAATRVPGAPEGQCNASLVLGGFGRGVTPLEMASAYGTFANEGKHVEAHFIDRVETARGEVVYKHETSPDRVLPEKVNAAMVDMMQAVVTGGTGTAAQLSGWPVAGKTGTTNENTDAWFVGYTPTLSTAVWTGYMRDQTSLGAGATGGGTPASMWRTYMTQALADQSPAPFPEVAYGTTPGGTGEPVTVPDVEGLYESSALTRLGQAKLIGQTQQVASSAPAGAVLWQSPDGGTAATVGETVYLGVSTGVPEVQRPVVEEPSREASPEPREEPERERKRNERKRDRDDDRKPRDRDAEQRPEPALPQDPKPLPRPPRPGD